MSHPKHPAVAARNLSEGRAANHSGWQRALHRLDVTRKSSVKWPVAGDVLGAVDGRPHGDRNRDRRLFVRHKPVPSRNRPLRRPDERDIIRPRAKALNSDAMTAGHLTNVTMTLRQSGGGRVRQRDVNLNKATGSGRGHGRSDLRQSHTYQLPAGFAEDDDRDPSRAQILLVAKISIGRDEHVEPGSLCRIE
ncbi:MAG: hypothetical protein ABIW19_01825 [Vicinamibacterales bacterium]